MNPAAILSLISELYAQTTAQNQRIQELETLLAEKTPAAHAETL